MELLSLSAAKGKELESAAVRLVAVSSLAVLLWLPKPAECAPGPDLPAAAQADRGVFNPIFLPGGVAAPSGETGYVTNSSGGISAVDLRSGQALWSTTDARQPLLVFGPRLAAAADTAPNQIRIVVLMAGNGKRLLESEPVVFPDWVSVRESPGKSFSASASVRGDDLLLSWEASSRYAGGAAPPPQIEQASHHTASGISRIDLQSGMVAMLPPGRTPDLRDLPGSLRSLKSQPYWTGTAWDTRPVMVDDRLAALTLQKSRTGEAAVLETWNVRTGRAYHPVTLIEGRSLWLQIPPGSQYVLIHQAVPKETLAGGDYAWWIFSLDTGKLAGKIPYDEEAVSIGVLGPRVYLITEAKTSAAAGIIPRTLKAIDLRTGGPLWSFPVDSRHILPPMP